MLFVRGKTSFPVGAALSRHLVRCKTSETAVHLAFAARFIMRTLFLKAALFGSTHNSFYNICASSALFEVSHSLAVCVK